MTGLHRNCVELNDFGIDPIALADWATRKQARGTLEAAFPHAEKEQLRQLMHGDSRLVQTSGVYTLKRYDVIVPIVPPQSEYVRPLVYD